MRLVVGPGRDQPVGAACPECCCFQELGREFAAVVFKRNRRHGQPDVAGEQGDDRVKVAVLVGPGEPGDQFLLCSGARGQGRPGFPRGRQPVSQGGTGALERTGHRLFAGVQDLCCLAGVKAENIPQDQHSALAGTGTAGR